MHDVRSSVLKDIMNAMLRKDSDRLRPKAAMVSVEAHPAGSPPAPQPPGYAAGGEVLDPSNHLHEGAESDLSPEDAEILEGLFSHPEAGFAGEPREGKNEAHEESDSSAQDDEDDDDAGNK